MFSKLKRKFPKVHIWCSRRNTSRRTRSQDINTVGDATINSNDVNRYRRRADIPIFRNEFIRIDTCLAFSSLPSNQLPHSSTCLPADYSFNHLSWLRFQESYLLRFHAAIEPPPPSLPLCIPPWGNSLSGCSSSASTSSTSRPFPVSPGRPRPSVFPVATGAHV